MIATFVATEAGTDDVHGAVCAGVSSTEPHQYLMFQRSVVVGDDEDSGIYFEYSDQINAGYGKIRTCKLQQDCLTVDLIEPVDHQKKYDRFEVQLRVSSAEWDSLAAGLRRIFTGQEHLLNISAEM